MAKSCTSSSNSCVTIDGVQQEIISKMICEIDYQMFPVVVQYSIQTESLHDDNGNSRFTYIMKIHPLSSRKMTKIPFVNENSTVLINNLSTCDFKYHPLIYFSESSFPLRFC